MHGERPAGQTPMLDRLRLPRRSEAIADALFADTADGVALLDEAGTVVRCNARFTSLMGTVPGTPAWRYLPRQADALAQALRAKQPANLAATKAGDPAPLSLRLTLLPKADRGALLRVADRTHEQLVEDQLGQAQRLQAVGELAGGIAHDFNNLLTAILGATEDLRTRAAARPQDLEELDVIQHGAERGAGLVRQLLAFGQQQTLQPHILALNDQVRATFGLLHRLLPASVVLELTLEEPGRMVRIDPTQLDQVLLNLAINASHAMPNGGRLCISTGHELRLRAQTVGGQAIPPGRYATLMVQDTGAGIPPDILPRIFEPFFTTRRGAGGTGLGLSTVHGIVRQSGGYMSVDSVIGQGTRFEILLPRHEEAQWQTAPVSIVAPTPPVARHAVGRTLLLVDDEAPVRKLAERVLTRAGWQVVAAACGEDALELVEAGDLAPALGCVISDVVMPGLDGPALVRALRQARPDLPAILMSGYADAGLRDALQAADIRFLSKPFAMADLVAALESLASQPLAA